MINSNPIGVYVPVSEVFPDIKSDFVTFRNLLNSLSRTDTLFWCARLNNIISHPSEIDHVTRQQFGISQFFTEKEVESVNTFVSKKGNPEHATIFFRGQLLELMRWVVLYCVDQPGDGTTFENQKVRLTFAKAALIAGDIWAKRVFGDRFSMEGGPQTSRRRALGTIRKAIEDNSKAPDLARSLGRGWNLFSDYFCNCYPSFEDEFESSVGLSVEQYYVCLCAIIINFTTVDALKKASGIIDINSMGQSTGHKELFQKYFAGESQSPDEMRVALWGNGQTDYVDFHDIPDYDYRSLRERPILRSNNGRGIVLDLSFYNEKATVGPLFSLLKGNIDSNRIFAAFGEAFEKYSCDILRRIFPDDSSQIAKRLYCNMKVVVPNKRNSSIEVDACIDLVLGF